MSDLLPGTIIRERYRVVELVGRGGGGAVYRATDLRLEGRVTALKQILPDQGAGKEAQAATREQFRTEASTLARLDHPGLPKVSDFFDDQATAYLVMDFVEGPDLRQMVDMARAEGELLDVKRVLEWVDQILDVLAYLHIQNPPVVHRDIKPANIKLVRGERIKLVDFGLVKPLDPQDPRTLTVARGVGSLPYTPLEQYAGDTGHTDVRADIYAVGATLYHLLTGRAPATAQERFLLPNALRRPRRYNPELAPWLEGAILQAMALHPEKRPPNVNTLRSLLSNEAKLVPDVELGTVGSAWRQALWDNTGLIALVGLLLLLTIVATWRASEDTPAPPTPVGFAVDDDVPQCAARDLWISTSPAGSATAEFGS